MSQTSVTRHYNFRKRNVNHNEVPKLPQNFTEDGKVKKDLVKEEQNLKTIRLPKTVKDNSNSQKSGASKDASKIKNPVPAKKLKKPTAANDKKTNGKQSTIKTFFAAESDQPKNEKTKVAKVKNCTSCVRQDRISSPFKITVESPNHGQPQSPKRNHPSPSDEGTPSKKKHLEENVSSATEAKATVKPKGTSHRKLKLDTLSSKSNPDIQSPEAKLITNTPQKNPRTPDQLDAFVDQSRIKLISSAKREDLKKALQEFSEITTKLKKKQSNPYMVNCIASSAKSHQTKKQLPTVDARERFNHLKEPDSLVLPPKYQVLSEMFRSMDSLVANMHNRKQNIIFDKVKEGVQSITKRNFSEQNLGQIVTIFPSAYNLSREKVNSICKENSSSEYQLIITLNFNADTGSNKKSAAFQHISPDFLKSRINEFNNNLLELVKKHHQDFLTRMNFVAKDSITRWHPKFSVGSVPDIPVAQLPKSPAKKIYTAAGVLNKVTRSFRNKVGKVMQTVAEDTEKPDVTLELKKLNVSKPETLKKELKGISLDILERIRGKESQELFKTMTQSPAETKHLAMLERVPKIVNILFLYFISECKTAMPLDKVVDKIIYSFDSLSTPDEVKEHLELIQKQFPFWLRFVEKKIPKGVYLTLNRITNITEMLDNARLN